MIDNIGFISRSTSLPLFCLFSQLRFCVALVMALRLKANAFCMLATVCSSWVFLSRSSTGRTMWRPLGRRNLRLVEDANVAWTTLHILFVSSKNMNMMSRYVVLCFVYRCVLRSMYGSVCFPWVYCGNIPKCTHLMYIICIQMGVSWLQGNGFQNDTHLMDIAVEACRIFVRTTHDQPAVLPSTDGAVHPCQRCVARIYLDGRFRRGIA